jgi:dihydrofolate synthase/folylpolyglutamate synthase
MNAMRAGLGASRQAGRFQIVGHQPLRILDVAHNPQAARSLADNLADLPPAGRILAVFAMLADKDIEGVIAPLKGRVSHWHAAGLDLPRGLSAVALAERLEALGCSVTRHGRVVDAWRVACREAGPADTIIAFGSFHTVAEVLADTSGGKDAHG